MPSDVGYLKKEQRKGYSKLKCYPIPRITPQKIKLTKEVKKKTQSKQKENKKFTVVLVMIFGAS